MLPPAFAILRIAATDAAAAAFAIFAVFMKFFAFRVAMLSFSLMRVTTQRRCRLLILLH